MLAVEQGLSFLVRFDEEVVHVAVHLIGRARASRARRPFSPTMLRNAVQSLPRSLFTQSVRFYYFLEIWCVLAASLEVCYYSFGRFSSSSGQSMLIISV